MNFLAHAYLSFNRDGILMGNMISDFLKGKKQFEYTGDIFKGIVLHRSIDTFTDAHPGTRAIKEYFKPHYGLYAAVFSDVVYDYFLANDETIFPDEHSLRDFVDKTIQSMQQQYEFMPEVFKPVFQRMQQQDWLFNYRFVWGIEKSFMGIAHRARYITESQTAFKIFLENIANFRPHYQEFFPLLKLHSEENLQRLLQSD